MCVFHKNRVHNNKACISYAGLAYETDESDLQDVFQQYGSLIEVKIVTDRDSGRSRGFGFVTYISRNAASNALWHMDGKVLCGRRIKVELAHQHCPRPSVRVNESGLEVNESGFEVNEFLYDSLNDSRYEFLNGYDEELKREWKNAMKADVEEARQYVSYLVYLYTTFMIVCFSCVKSMITMTN
ncbi:hypothetical protein Lser_V15G30278 [Lactuca serriola]